MAGSLNKVSVAHPEQSQILLGHTENSVASQSDLKKEHDLRFTCCLNVARLASDFATKVCAKQYLSDVNAVFLSYFEAIKRLND